MIHPSTLDLGASRGRADTRSHRPRFTVGRLWPWIPALLLGSLIGVQMTVLAFVLDDPTFATEEDYYRKAVDWDARMLRQRQSQALGWTAELSVASTRPHPVSLQLRDARGNAVSNARVNAVAFHNARARHPLVLALEEVSPGLYHVELGAVRPGLWELRLRASRGRDHHETTHRFEVPTDGDAH
jgi:nitrogen fixation protein FixH